MKLHAPFTQLPICFDAERLTAEVGAFGESPWRPHPQGYVGNDFLPLLSVNGDPRNETFEGPMRPTPFLEQSPYLVDVMARIGASLGRTRLMRLSGHAEVSEHVDVHYYWRDHMRVHVPIITQPTVTFYCGDQQTHMAAGECWIFDTWRLHRVINDAERSRVHLVIDTVGGGPFFELARRGKRPEQDIAGWAPQMVAAYGAQIRDLPLEAYNLPLVMTPWEAGEHIRFLLSEAEQSSSGFLQVAEDCRRFLELWRSLWAIYGEDSAGRPHYKKVLIGFVDLLKAHHAERVPMRNGVDLAICIMSLVVNVALGNEQVERRRSAPAPAI
jgi:hypothetical protein